MSGFGSQGGLVRAAMRWLLAAFMLVAGLSHLVATDEFLGLVPTWLPLRVPIVWLSGLVEIALALALVLPDHRRRAGRALAVLLVLVFPGNLVQAIAATDAFGLDSPTERWGRLLAQPVLILWAVWCTTDER